MYVFTTNVTARTATFQGLQERIESLPQESLVELANYVDFLRFKAGNVPANRRAKPLHIIKLRGLLKGYDFPPELLAETRKEMWRKFQEY